MKMNSYRTRCGSNIGHLCNFFLWKTIINFYGIKENNYRSDCPGPKKRIKEK